MRTPREHSHLATTTSVLCALALLGCQGILESPPEKDVEGNSTNPGDGDSTDPMVIPGVDDPRTCVQGIPGTTQIPRLLNREYDAVVQDLLGVTSLASAAGARPSALLVPDYQGSMTDIAWNSYLVTARDIAAEVMAGTNRSNFITCDPAAPGCLTDTIRNFGRKAFRRPVTETEVESFERLNNLDPAGTPEEVAQAMLFAFLASPSFLLLPELSTELDGDTVKLSQHEVAARLSFMLWGSVPDQTLSAAADAGALATKEQIFEQAQRMVQDRARTDRHRLPSTIRPDC
jgi:hypothetical protein